jgi:4-hydroxybenzoate polyprenyltransferase
MTNRHDLGGARDEVDACPPSPSAGHSVPLVVDLDGTLVGTDTLHEAALRLLRDRPQKVFGIPGLLARGKAVLKARLAQDTTFHPEALPYQRDFLDWLGEQRAQGRILVLCTAADRVVAEAIANHLGLFDEVMASDGTTNLAGENKALALENRFGSNAFDYAGNSRTDLPVWKRARRAIVVNGSSRLVDKAAILCPVERVFSSERPGVTGWRHVLRLHQWFKNILLFVPLLAAHRLTEIDTWLSMGLAFFSFSVCASAVYVTNDLSDLDSDRLHPRKKFRPFASGLVPVWIGVVLAPILLMVGFSLGAVVGGTFLPWLAAYFILTCAYTLGLKRIVLVDCLTLAILYTLRIISGAAAADMSLSFWLLAFSVFLFLSLSFVKRYAELEVKGRNGEEKLHGRGYYTSDASLIQTLGIAAGYASILVLALYLNSTAVARLYATPEIVWGCVPTLAFWISWVWLKAHRGEMHDDPLVFALKDKASLVSGVVFTAIIILGGISWS